jgi:hypothetical protein
MQLANRFDATRTFLGARYGSCSVPSMHASQSSREHNQSASGCQAHVAPIAGLAPLDAPRLVP